MNLNPNTTTPFPATNFKPTENQLNAQERRQRCCEEILTVLELGDGTPMHSTEIRPLLTTDSKDVWQTSVNSLVEQGFVVRVGNKSQTKYMIAANYNGEFTDYIPVKEKKKGKPLPKKDVLAEKVEDFNKARDTYEKTIADLREENIRLSDEVAFSTPLLTLRVYSDDVRMSHTDTLHLLDALGRLK